MAVPSSNIKLGPVGGNRVQDPYEAERLRLAEQAARKAGANNQPVVNQPQYSYLKDNQGNATNVLDPRKTPGIGEAMTVEQAQKQGLLGVPQSKPLESLSDVVKQTKQTYAQQAEDQLRGQFLTEYQNAQKFGIELPYKTFEDYKAYKDSGFASDKAYLEKQQGISRGLEASQATTAMEQLGGAQRAVTASMAQSREGAMGSSKPQFVAEFSTQIQRQRDQIVAQRESAELERTRAMEELKRAKESGDVALAKAIQGQLSAIETNIRQIDSQALEAATLANEQALKAMQFELDKTTTEQATQRANLTTFTDLVNQGVELSPDSLINFASSLNVPFEAAYSYYQGAKQIREDKTLDAEGKRIANQQNLQNLNDQINRVTTTAAQNVEYLKNLYASGADEKTISAFKAAAGIPDQNDPMYKLKVQAQQLQNAVSEYEVKYLGKPPPEGSPERLDYDIKKALLMKNQYETGELLGTNREISGSQAQEIFQIPGKSKYRSVGWECGEAYNKITNGPKVGDSYTNKLAAATDANGNLRQGMPQVGNGLVIPIGNAKWGHIETVISTNLANNTFQTVSWNRDLNGGQTVQTYSLSDLQNGSKYGNNWGFTDSQLKPEYQEKLASSAIGTPAGDSLYQQALNEANRMGMPEKEAQKFASERVKESFKPMTEAQGKAYNAFVIMTDENTNYSQLSDSIGSQELADGIGLINRQLKEGDSLTADLIRENVTNSRVAEAINSEVRWLEAALREESGAVITVEEYRQKGPSYFPRPGDSEAEIQRKASLRERVTKAKEGKMGPSGQRVYQESFGGGNGGGQSVTQTFDAKALYQDLLSNEQMGLDMNEINSIFR